MMFHWMWPKKWCVLLRSLAVSALSTRRNIIEDEMTYEAKQIFPPNADVSICEVMTNCALSLDHEIASRDYTESLGMIYISTPFSHAAADFLSEVDVPAFKIGSGEADNLPLICHIDRFGKPVIMSKGT